MLELMADTRTQDKSAEPNPGGTAKTSTTVEIAPGLVERFEQSKRRDTVKNLLNAGLLLLLEASVDDREAAIMRISDHFDTGCPIAPPSDVEQSRRMARQMRIIQLATELGQQGPS